MQKKSKIIMFALFISILFTCVSLLFVFGLINWLNSYNLYTNKAPIAEITISEKKNDDHGQYSEIQIILYKRTSALAFAMGQPPKEDNIQLGDPINHKIYGDTVYISGPIINFHKDNSLNLSTIYKVGKLYGRYDMDPNKELTNKSDISQFLSTDLNGGYEDWVRIFNDIRNDNLTGKIYKSYISSTTLSTSGIAVRDSQRSYTIFISENGFIYEPMN